MFIFVFCSQSTFSLFSWILLCCMCYKPKNKIGSPSYQEICMMLPMTFCHVITTSIRRWINATHMLDLVTFWHLFLRNELHM